MATASDFQIPRLPLLTDVMGDSKVITLEVARRYDARLEEWRRNVQRQLIDKFEGKDTTATT